MANKEQVLVPTEKDQPHTSSLGQQTFHSDNIDEQNHFNDVCRAYRQYGMFAVRQFGLNYPNRVANMSTSQQALLPAHLQYGTVEFQQRLKECKDAAIRNQFVLDCILRHAGQPISMEHQQQPADGVYATEAQLSKVTTVLKNLMRDWSLEGAAERNMAYQPILQSVQKYLPISVSGSDGYNPPPIKLCVPGAGVGRLACELAGLGYTVQGNEFSLYMLFAADFILNGPVVPVSSTIEGNDKNSASKTEEGEYTQNTPIPLSISPFLLETRNVHNMMDPFRKVQIPDVNPFDMVTSSTNSKIISPENESATTMTTATASTSLVNETLSSSRSVGTTSAPTAIGADFSMTAGDFDSIYSVESEANAWDGVVSCFFLDTSPNVIQYLQTIHQMLKPNGLLFNFGPLLWHWSGPAMLLTDENMSDYIDRYDHLDKKYLQSYDYTWEDIQVLLSKIGFDVVEQSIDIPAHYTADPSSMLQTVYRCVHFVARKRSTNHTTNGS
jgi:carnosine N-methyltransferase